MPPPTKVKPSGKEKLKRNEHMAGHKPFSELRAKMSPAAQARAAVKTELLAAVMDIAELLQEARQSQGLTPGGFAGIVKG